MFRVVTDRTSLVVQIQQQLHEAQLQQNVADINKYQLWLDRVLYGEPLYYAEALDVPESRRNCALLVMEQPNTYVCASDLFLELKTQDSGHDWDVARQILAIKQQRGDLDPKIRRNTIYALPGTMQQLQTKHSYYYAQDGVTKHYRLVRVAKQQEYLGKGSFGKVKQAIDEFGNVYAVKIERAENASVFKIEKQILEHLQLLNGEFIRTRPFPTFDKYTRKTMKDKHYTVLNNILGRSFDKYITDGTLHKTSTWDRQLLALQMVAAMNAIHKKHVLHCDSKPGNMMVAFNRWFSKVRVIDFDISMLVSDMQKFYSDCTKGSPSYIPPEVSKLIVFSLEKQKVELVSSCEYRKNTSMYIYIGIEINSEVQYIIQNVGDPGKFMAITHAAYVANPALQHGYVLVGSIAPKQPIYSKFGDIYSLGILLFFDLGLQKCPIVIKMCSENMHDRPELSVVIKELTGYIANDPRNNPARALLAQTIEQYVDSDEYFTMMRRIFKFSEQLLTQPLVQQMQMVVKMQELLQNIDNVQARVFKAFLNHIAGELLQEQEYWQQIAKQEFIKIHARIEEHTTNILKIQECATLIVELERGNIRFANPYVGLQITKLLQQEKKLLERYGKPNGGLRNIFPDEMIIRAHEVPKKSTAPLVQPPKDTVKRKVNMGFDPNFLEILNTNVVQHLYNMQMILQGIDWLNFMQTKFGGNLKTASAEIELGDLFKVMEFLHIDIKEEGIVKKENIEKIYKCRAEWVEKSLAYVLHYLDILKQYINLHSSGFAEGSKEIRKIIECLRKMKTASSFPLGSDFNTNIYLKFKDILQQANHIFKETEAPLSTPKVVSSPMVRGLVKTPADKRKDRFLGQSKDEHELQLSPIVHSSPLQTGQLHAVVEVLHIPGSFRREVKEDLELYTPPSSPVTAKDVHVATLKEHSGIEHKSHDVLKLVGEEKLMVDFRQKRPEKVEVDGGAEAADESSYTPIAVALQAASKKRLSAEHKQDRVSPLPSPVSSGEHVCQLTPLDLLQQHDTAQKSPRHGFFSKTKSTPAFRFASPARDKKTVPPTNPVLETPRSGRALTPTFQHRSDVVNVSDVALPKQQDKPVLSARLTI